MSGLDGEADKAALTVREIEAVAPNLGDQMYLYRVTNGFAEPPFCSIHELETVITLDRLADFHEALDLRYAAQAKAMREVKRRQQDQQGRRGRR